MPEEKETEKTETKKQLASDQVKVTQAKVSKIECIFCDVPLQFNEEHGFWRCPDCGGEWWPGPSDYDMVTLWRDEQAYKRSISKQGGGSRTKSKKSRKDTTKIQQPWLHET